MKSLNRKLKMLSTVWRTKLLSRKLKMLIIVGLLCDAVGFVIVILYLVDSLKLIMQPSWVRFDIADIGESLIALGLFLFFVVEVALLDKSRKAQMVNRLS